MASLRDENGYAPIGSYALLGDGHGSALVTEDGSIDWLAVPGLDTAPFLSAILDSREGGQFVVRPVGDFEVRRRYLDDSMVLETTFETETGLLRVTDALVQGFQGRLPWSELARKLEVDKGEVALSWRLRPGTRLATVRPWLFEADGRPFVLAGELLASLVLSNAGEPTVGEEAVEATTVLRPGEAGLLALVVSEGKPLRLPEPDDVLRRLEHTEESWRTWSELIGYEGPHRQHVVRSALTMKALSCSDSGALAAAPTTSLPEVVGESRNFDYRYGWVRDSSFMIDAMTRLGLSEEVDAGLGWLLRCVKTTAPDVHVFYTLKGDPAPAAQEENSLLAGYKGSQPVMIGNKAAGQAQRGSYGDLLGAVARHVEGGARLDDETGRVVAEMVDRLCDEWCKPDAGLWELGQEQHYTSSLIGAWTAFDRACTLARRGEIPSRHLERWQENAQAVRRFVDENCWSEAKQSYTFYAGTEELDAATLLAARTGFSAPDDRRLWSTIDAVRRELTADGPWLYRYSGAAKEEHAFVACTFWLVEALAYCGRSEEASSLLDGALKQANDVGLWSEEFDTSAGELLGNFPIGISHLAVVGAITQLFGS